MGLVWSLLNLLIHFSDHVCLQLCDSDLLVTHLVLLCISDSRSTCPMQHMARLPNKSSFCAVNGNCLTEQHMLTQIESLS